MKLKNIATGIGARIIANDASDGIEIERVYAGDRMSDLMNEVGDTTLLVTNIAHVTLVRLVELMDLPAICLVNGAEPEPVLAEAVLNHGAAVMVSPFGVFETCGRIYRLLGEGEGPAAS